MSTRPLRTDLVGKDPQEVPMSLQRIFASAEKADSLWVGPKEAKALSKDDQKAYDLAHKILCHLVIQAPTKHASGHPGGALSAFTFAYLLSKRRDSSVDQPLRISAGHLSLLSFGLQWLFGREGHDVRLQSPQTIIDMFRIPSGLPGHVEAGIGDMPFGTGPLGKGVSHALGAAFGLKLQHKKGTVDVLLADGDAQEGQVFEAFRLASHLRCDNLIVHGDFNDIQLSDLPSRTVAPDFAMMAAAAGWRVIEVQNGNDPAQVQAALDLADGFVGKGHPIFVCYYTTMGHGVRVMEEGSNTGKENFHGSPLKKDVAEKALQDLPSLDTLVKDYEPFRKKELARYKANPKIETDILLPWKPDQLEKKGYVRTVMKEKGAARKDFGETHVRNLMKADSRIAVLHADLAASGGFDKVLKEFPDRVINVGVAEANMYMMAAGMRQTGLLPVTYTFAAFGTNEARASARLIDINCKHTRCGVLHDCTHTGLSVGEDGETHQERHYLNVPFDHTQVWMPADSNQAGAAAEKAFELIAEGHTNVYVFSPRSGHAQLMSPDGTPIYGKDHVFDGKIDLVRGTGGLDDEVTIVATGIAVHDAIAAADKAWEEDKIRVRVLNVSCIRPLDASAIVQAALETVHLIVAEDHSSEGGLATQVADVIADYQLLCSLRRLGVNHSFPSGTAEDLKFLAGLDTDSILDAIRDERKTEVCGGEDVVVTAVYALADKEHRSRFHEMAKPFVDRVLSEKGYLESLRQKWAKRACPKDMMPSMEQLRKRLSGEI
jgi:transketolase